MRKKRQPPNHPISWSDAAARVVEEFEDESKSNQFRFDGVQHGIRIESQADGLLAIVLLGMIVGCVAVLFTVSFDSWVGSSLFLALACFAVSLGQTLLHARSLRRLAAHADSVTMDDDSATEQFDEMQTESNNAATFQLLMTTVGALLIAVGMIIHFWQYAWRAALIAFGAKAFFLVVGALTPSLTKSRD